MHLIPAKAFEYDGVTTTSSTRRTEEQRPTEKGEPHLAALMLSQADTVDLFRRRPLLLHNVGSGRTVLNWFTPLYWPSEWGWDS